jgi:hypothetical protein
MSSKNIESNEVIVEEKNGEQWNSVFSFDWQNYFN